MFYVHIVFPAPLNLLASNVNSRSLELSWDPPDLSSTEVTLTGYSVFCNSSQVGLSVSASTTNRVVNNLIPYTTYTCTVDANFGSNIGQSNPITKTTLEEGKQLIDRVIIIVVVLILPWCTINCL